MGKVEIKANIMVLHKKVAKEAREKGKEESNGESLEQTPDIKKDVKNSIIAEVRQILWLLDKKLMNESNAVKAIAAISSNAGPGH